MKRLLLAALVFLAACAPLHKQKVAPAPSIQQLCNEQRYVTALNALEAQRRSTPDYDQQREAILAQAHDYQTKLLRDAAELIRQQQFLKAQMLLETAQPELPESAELTQFNQQLAMQRDRYTQRYSDELILLKATQLQKEHPLYLALQKSAIDPDLQDSIDRHNADVNYFSPLIAKAGAQALEKNNYSKAQQLLSIANQLAPSPQIAQQLARAEQALLSTRKKQQVAQTAEREQRYRELSSAIPPLLQQRDFVAARELLAQARELSIHSEELDTTQRQLDNAIATYVAQQVDAGNRYYADGNIEQALSCWRQAEALSPTPDIREKIEKVQKFIDRLQELQKRPARN